MDDISRSISNRLKWYRKKHGFTQEEFAKIISSTEITVSAWERGLRKPTIETAVYIYKITGCDILSNLLYDLKQ